jgi:hypothetical protein
MSFELSRPSRARRIATFSTVSRSRYVPMWFRPARVRDGFGISISLPHSVWLPVRMGPRL